MSDIFQLPAYLTKYESKGGGSIKFTFETQENLNPDHIALLASYHEKPGWLNFAVRRLEALDIADLPDIDGTKYDQSKSPAQRLRAVIYLYHQQKGGKREEFDAYYLQTMERIINQYKDKLE